MTDNTLYDEIIKNGSAKLVQTAAASNAASVQFVNLTTDYHTYIFDLVSLTPSVNGAYLFARISNDNGVTWQTAETYWWSIIVNYSHQAAQANASGSAYAGAGVHRTYFQMSGGQYNPITLVARMIFRRSLYQFGRPFQWWCSHHQSTSGYGSEHVIGHGVNSNVTDVNGVMFLYNTGTFTGTIRCYGMRSG